MPLNPIGFSSGLYPGAGQAGLLRAGESVYLIQSQIITPTQATVAVQLERIKAGFFYPFGASFEVSFSANPGSFEVDFQTADTDNANYYVTIASLTGGLNSNYVGRIEVPSFWARYLRANIPTLANSSTVKVTIQATR